MKLFLVTAGEDHYPQHGELDWVACFKTLREAREYVENAKSERSDCRYWFKDKDITADWVRIIDLNKWIF